VTDGADDPDAGAGSDPVYSVDGALVPAREATVRVDDRGFQYGDGAFETLRAYGGTVFEWPAHRERLERACDRLGMPDAVPADAGDRLRAVLAANDFDDAYLKLSITRGVQPGTLTPATDVDPTVVVYAKPLPRGGVDGDPAWDGPARLRTVDVRRPPDAAVPAEVKTHNYLASILARLELRGTDADEALLTDAAGDVACGAACNLLFVDDGRLHTPSLDGPVLPGVTRRVVLELAREAGVAVREGSYAPATVRAADEAFATNSTWQVRPVASVDGVPVGGGPVTTRLSRLFDERVERLYG
jgi:branched-chain amino acid aminotransferase